MKRLFLERYAILLAVRNLHETKSTVVPQAGRLALMRVFLDGDDIADLAIEEFRRWKHWDATKQIVELYGTPVAKSSIARQSVLRFALQSPRPEAAAFIARMRKQDAEAVANAEQFLKNEPGPN